MAIQSRNSLSVLRAGTTLTTVLLFAAPAFAQSQGSSPGAPVGQEQSEVPISQSEAPGQTAEESVTTSADPNDPEARDDDIVVTGTNIRGVPPIGSPLISVTRDDIVATGTATVQDLMATIPQVSAFNTLPVGPNGGLSLIAPSLRNLGAGATLSLLNGRRLVASGSVNSNTPDPSVIPNSAIERVEIVADGASATYGSDAVGGVINFITRKNFSGSETSVRYGVADNYEAFDFGQVFGHTWSAGSALVAYQYAGHSNIERSERDYINQDNRPLGGLDFRATTCSPPNVLIPQTGATLYAFPALLPNTTNFCDADAGTVDLYPKSRRHSVFATARQELFDGVELWGEFLYSDQDAEQRAAVPVAAVTIRNTNPFFIRPPGTAATQETVRVRLDNIFGADFLVSPQRSKAGQVTAGVDIALPRDFQLVVYGLYGWSSKDTVFPLSNAAAVAVAAAGTTTATALDPFGNGTSATVAASIRDFTQASVVKQRLYDGTAQLDGPLFTLPGGDVKIALGGQVRRERFPSFTTVGTAAAPTVIPGDATRTVKSAFAELFIPLFGDSNATTLFQRLDLSLSARHDNYSDFGSTTNPKVGVNWAPFDGLTFRGSYGKSFRAPQLFDTSQAFTALFTPGANLGPFRDPTRTIQVDTLVLRGGNPNLDPERARIYSLGADFAPRFLRNFRAGITYYNIHYVDAIGQPSTATLFTDPSLAGVIVRNPTPEQLATILMGNAILGAPNPVPPIGNIVDIRRANFGVRDIEGLDFDASYRLDTSFGRVFTGVTGNRILRFDTQATPTSPVASAFQGVKWRVRGTLGAEIGPVTALTFVNYTGSFIGTYQTTAGPLAEFDVKPYTTVDLRLTLKLPDVGWSSGTELAFQVNDLFDKDPPIFPSIDGVRGDINPIGRFVAVNLRKRF